MSIYLGMVFNSTCPESPLQGLHRVLQIQNGEDEVEVVIIKIPTEPSQGDGAKQKNYYVKGFFKRTLNELMAWEDLKLICEVEIMYPALWDMSDEAIREKYPPRNGSSESYPIATRDRKLKIIKSIIPNGDDNALVNLMDLDKKAGEQAIEFDASKGQVLDALHTYYAFGCIENSLIPNMFFCGAPEKERIAKNGIKLGRKNAAALIGKIDLQGKMLTDTDRLNLRNGWEMYVRPGTTVSEAFLGMSAAFYNNGHSIRYGKYSVDLMEAHLRPTESEFRYHGPKSRDDASAARLIMGEGGWLKNCRELGGSAQSGVFSIGQVGSIDASPNDVNEVSCFDPLKPIGVGRAIVVTDVKIGLIFGWHIAIGGIGTDDANLAISCAANDKSELLKRFGLEDIPAKDFAAIFFSKYISDNGELRSIAGIDASVQKLGSRIEFVPSGRADFNSVSESGHHSRNRGLNHHLKGTTKGRQKKRGEPLAITLALITHYQYNRLFIKWVHWKNTKQQVPHLLTVEMRRDNVESTRIAIYRWALQKGYVTGKPVDLKHAKAHLLPTFTASIQRNGLILHRPKTGNTVELLHGARFSDNYLATSGIIRDMLNGGKKHIEVKADPDDLSKVFLFDKNGVHVIKNVSDDVLLIHEGCMADLGALNDANRQDRVETASQTDQDLSDIRSLRVEEEAEASRKKKAALSKAGSTSKTKTDRSSVRQNQADEKIEQMNQAVQRAVPSAINTAFCDTPSVSNHEKSSKRQNIKMPSEPVVAKKLVDVRQAQLKKFHDTRGTLK